ncbi:hypothetical protein Dimus_017298 [Dionaea muscipula]
MPTFTALALDRLLDPGASKSAAASNKSAASPSSSPAAVEAAVVLDSRTESRAAAAFNAGDAKSGTRRPPVPHPKLWRKDSMPAETERRAQWPPISPALYATPETTPLPDSPDSDTTSMIPSSPYLINHKRRGPRLLKSSSEQNVASKAKKYEKLGESAEASNGHLSDTDVANNGHLCNGEMVSNGRLRETEGTINCSVANGVSGDTVVEEVKVNGFHGREIGDGKEGNGVMGGDGELEVVGGLSVEGEGETEDFFDLQESLSYTSNTDMEDNNAERSGRMSTPGGEFFDACDELCSDSGRQSQRRTYNLEAELREMRLSFLMEIERRKQAEEALDNMRNHWQMLRDKMKNAGLVLPPDSFPEDGNLDVDTAEEICQQIYLARRVSECIAMEVAKAETEAEMEAHLEVKNFEIARLNDRLHYYVTMNREMSQRNQEAIERARHDRHKRRRRLRWVWGSVAVAITVGSIALAWSYAPGGKVSSSTAPLDAAEPGTAADCSTSHQKLSELHL